MVFIYTAEGCVKCENKKAEWDAAGFNYVERDASRMKQPEDDIDREALIQASMQNLVLPVIVTAWEKGV